MKIDKNKYFEVFNEHLKFSKKTKDLLLNKKIEISLNDFKNWDSMSHVLILTNLQKKLNISINSSNSEYFNSYQLGLKYLNKKK